MDLHELADTLVKLSNSTIRRCTLHLDDLDEEKIPTLIEIANHPSMVKMFIERETLENLLSAIQSYSEVLASFQGRLMLHTTHPSEDDWEKRVETQLANIREGNFDLSQVYEGNGGSRSVYVTMYK